MSETDIYPPYCGNCNAGIERAPSYIAAHYGVTHQHTSGYVYCWSTGLRAVATQPAPRPLVPAPARSAVAR